MKKKISFIIFELCFAIVICACQISLLGLWQITEQSFYYWVSWLVTILWLSLIYVISSLLKKDKDK